MLKCIVLAEIFVLLIEETRLKVDYIDGNDLSTLMGKVFVMKRMMMSQKT